MRKHVKPALPTAVIPDPERRRDLPPEGYPVTWSVHWERMLARGDILVTDLPDADEAPAPQPQPEPTAAPDASPDSTEPAASDHHPDA